MKNLLLAVLLLASPSVFAEKVFKGVSSGGIEFMIRLHTTPCAAPVMIAHLERLIKNDVYKKGWMAASFLWNGKEHAACWRHGLLSTNVYMYDDAGDPFNPPSGVSFDNFVEEYI